ncbi:uncharacterized protein LOC113214275 [Frankliniella occidentalis]|uniref:Odorant receptor n=1 Tax=Frankliniella occidentalis TaxID=133901 RepID=A0A6J1T6Y3_FRAOC|nr:uncharacterized protein LOC113214275 [Frankliniella occidentalis]
MGDKDVPAKFPAWFLRTRASRGRGNERGSKPRPRTPDDTTLFVTNLTLLRWTGFWRQPAPPAGGPGDGRTDGAWARARAAAQRAFFNVNMVCNVAFITTKVVHTALDTDNIRNITENLSDVLCIAFSLLQLVVLTDVEPRLLKLLDRIDGQLEHVLHATGVGPEGLERQRRVCRDVAIRTFAGFLFTGLNFGVVVTSTGKSKNALPIAIWTPFRQDAPGTLSILLMVEAVGVVLTVAGSGALSALFLNSFLVVQSQFRALHGYFQAEAEGLPDGAWDTAAKRRTRERLVQGVKLHQGVLSLADETCEVLSPFVAVQLGTIGFIICVALFQISVDPMDPGNSRFVVLAATITVEAFVLCYMGTLLSDQAMEVQLGLEFGNWYLQGQEIGYIVKFASMRSQKVPAVVVGNVHVGLPLFLEIIRSSYSLLAFLQKRARSEDTQDLA